MGSQEGQLVSIKNSDRSWALQLLMDMGLPLDEQPENIWASTRWAWTGLRKTENNVGKIKKNNRYSVEDWQWADGIIPGMNYRMVEINCSSPNFLNFHERFL